MKTAWCNPAVPPVNFRRALAAIALTAAFLSGSGCASTAGVSGPIDTLTDPELGRKYLLYRPAAYDRSKEWPLVVACHSSFPDSQNRRIQAWGDTAESRGLLVLAPRLEAPSGMVGKGGTTDEIKDDVRHILSAIQHVRAGHSISDDRIFLHGYSGGSAAALYAGLSHSDLFRAIALTQPRFSAVALAEVEPLIDPYQPVYVHYSITDKLTGGEGRNCSEWLLKQTASAIVNPQGEAGGKDVLPAVEFYEETLRKIPWIHIRAFAEDPAKPRQFRFKLQCSFTPIAYHWEFGDGQTSPVAEPVHPYANPGAYRATVTVTGPRGATHRRGTNVRVP